MAKDTLSLSANLDMSGEWLERLGKRSAREKQLEIVKYWIKYKRIKPEQIMVIEVPDICKPW